MLTVDKKIPENNTVNLQNNNRNALNCDKRKYHPKNKKNYKNNGLSFQNLNSQQNYPVQGSSSLNVHSVHTTCESKNRYHQNDRRKHDYKPPAQNNLFQKMNSRDVDCYFDDRPNLKKLHINNPTQYQNRKFVNRKSQFKERKRKQNNKRIEKETLHDQAAIMAEQLSSGKYECMICTDDVAVRDQIWSCQICSHVFHIKCIKKWATSGNAQVQANDENKITGWRCPGCQNITSKVPQEYYCFCGKRKKPPYKQGELPHSCGNVCGKKRKSEDCKHSCTILCHPGPCPKCPAMVRTKCRCGEETFMERCHSQQKHVCKKICNKKLNCKAHQCDNICCEHCNDCNIVVKQSCFCGSSSRELICGSEEYFESLQLSNDKEISFSCSSPCQKLLSCGEHYCELKCHPGECNPCPLTPGLVQTCPCGQTGVEKLEQASKPRNMCTDPLLTCNNICGKPLKCGGKRLHLCKMKCHHGPCLPCSDTKTSLNCRCGKSTTNIKCSEFKENYEFQCNRKCNKLQSCKRHKCKRICCDMEFHICDEVCGKKLSCGLHKCELPCHKGRCRACLESSFNELTCYCGEEIIYPPVPCNTKPPKCNRMCNRMHACDHVVRHNCHMEEECPPCTELVRKQCNCGRLIRNNIQCSIKIVSCGMRCVKILSCGHQCSKKCHQGECLRVDQVCKQPCKTIRVDCGHPCNLPCHFSTPCQTSSCNFEVVVKCICGRIEQKVTCKARDKLKTKFFLNKLNKDQSNESKFVSLETGCNILPCDEKCRQIARNLKMAKALNINDKNNGEVFPQPVYSDFLRQYVKKDSKFVKNIENEISKIIDDIRWLDKTNISHSFPDMKKEKRQVIHELAEAFKCTSISYGSDPKRYVCVSATKHQSVEPHKFLSQVVLEEDNKLRNTRNAVTSTMNLSQLASPPHLRKLEPTKIPNNWDDESVEDNTTVTSLNTNSSLNVDAAEFVPKFMQ